MSSNDLGALALLLVHFTSRRYPIEALRAAAAIISFN